MMTVKTEAGLDQYVSIRYLHPEQCTFRRTPGGFVSMELESGEKYARVNLFRAFPFTSAEEYISVRNPEGKELGMLRSIQAFPAEVVGLLEEEINRRYFAPVIREILTIKEEFGYSYWEVATHAGLCRFTVKGGTQGVIPIDESRVLVVDVDGTRYEIPDVNKLDEKSQKKLEVFL